MSNLRHGVETGVLVRFWSLDHYRAESVPWPVSSWPKLVYAAEGTLQVESREKLWILPRNRALWVPAGESHRSATLGKVSVRTLYFSPDLTIDRESSLIEISPLFRELIIETCHVGPLVLGHPRFESLATLLLVELERAQPLPSGILMPQSEWLRDWASKFMINALEFPSYDCSRRTLERQMLKETGLTLGQWCQQARAIIGLRSLATGSTVEEAATEAGFATASGFIKSFRSRFGITPGRVI